MAQAQPVGSSYLVQAIKANDVDRVRTAVSSAASGTERESLLAQGLSVACEQNRPDVVQRVLSLGADPKRKFGNRPPPLLIAVVRDLKGIVHHLLESEKWNQNAELRRDLQRTALTTAKSRDIAELLIENGANIRSTGKEGKTLLMDVRCPAVVKLLIEKNVTVEAKDSDGRTALMNTLIADSDPAIAMLLIHQGRADIEARDNKDRTILMTAVWKSRTGVLKLLLDRRVDVHAVDNKGRTALHHIASDKKRTYEYRSDLPASKKPAQQELDQCILDELLKARIKPEARDKLGRTCLHWAAANGCSGLLKIFLKTNRFPVNAVERRSKTPLHLAATLGHSQCLQFLLNEGASVHAESDGEWTPLHCACESSRDSVNAVTMLLDYGAVLHRKTRSGATPLHVAAAAGNIAVVNFLLRRPDVKRATRDSFGNTPLLRAASVMHKNREEIVKLFAPWNNLDSLSKEAKQAAQLFQATVVDFGEEFDRKGFGWTGSSVKTTSVFDLLYGQDPVDTAKSQTPAVPQDSKPDTFRWIHFPANNVSWCQDLFTKHFIEEGAVDVNSFKSLERSFNHQHRGHEPQSRYMTPLCQTVIRSWGSEESGYMSDEGTDPGPSRRSTFNQRSEQAISDTGSPRRTQDIKNRDVETVRKQIRSESFRKQDPEKGRRKPPFAPLVDQKLVDEGSISDFYVFMPYIHFETYRERQEMFESYNESDCTLATSPSLSCEDEKNDHTCATYIPDGHNVPSEEKDKALFRAHLNTSDCALHIRRTLDQSFYHHINTKYRDSDQVIHRFQKEVLKCDEAKFEPKVLMVDQLWMWVLGKKLVITSFPQRWRQPKKDPLNMLESILAIINSSNRERVHSVYELAMIISGRCYGAYDRHGIGSDEPQFLDMFEGWIGAAMDDEVKLFERFKQDSKNASEWLRNPRSLRDIQRRQRKKFMPPIVPSPEFKVIKRPDEATYDPSSSFVENLLDIGWETELLGEIKDIRDELDMLSLVFERQEQVMPGIQDAIEAIGKQQNWLPATRDKFGKAFQDHRKTVSHPQKDIQRMERQAKRMYSSIRDLLDLKQKHANAIEARYAREQTDDTSRQGKTLMVFTIVTVIFLPLSFIAAFFAINLVELPHKSGSQELSLAFVSK